MPITRVYMSKLLQKDKRQTKLTFNKAPTFPDSVFLSKVLGTECKTLPLSTEAVLLTRWGFVFREAPADKSCLLVLGECPSSERPLLVGHALMSPPPPSESELSPYVTAPPLGLMGLRLFVLV